MQKKFAKVLTNGKIAVYLHILFNQHDNATKNEKRRVNKKRAI